MEKKLILHVTPSTHWDREWYLTMRQTQVRLSRVMQKLTKLMENPEYTHFLMDGQVVPYYDYLEAYPEKRQEIDRLSEEGRLIWGPWYVVPDLLVPSGESVIRNLAFGKALCPGENAYSTVAYTPDTFGFPAQMPQIFRQFGFEYAQYCQGQCSPDGKRHPELLWTAPDGSSILTVYEHYSNGIWMSYTDVWRNMKLQDPKPADVLGIAEEIAQTQDESYISAHRQCMVGIDHAEPKDNIITMVKYINAHSDCIEARFDGFEDYFTCLTEYRDELPELLGEQAGPYGEHFKHSNILSTRMDMKLLNRHVENALEKMSYPLEAFSAALGSDYEYFDLSGINNLASKLMILSHAHDSLWGSMVDEANHDAKERLLDAQSLAMDSARISLHKIARTTKPFDRTGVCIILYNPCQTKQSHKINQLIRIPYRLEKDQYGLLDFEGNPVPGALVTVQQRKRIDIETVKEDDQVLFHDETRTLLMQDASSYDICSMCSISFLAENLPEVGYRCYYLTEEILPKEPSVKYDVSRRYADNGLISLQINKNGTVDVTELQTGNTLKGQHWLEDQGDEGDEYTFSPTGEISDTRLLEPVVTLDKADVDTVTYKIEYDQPCPVAVYVTLTEGSYNVDFHTVINNTKSNHRVRAVFDMPFSAVKSYSDTAFDITARPIFEKSDALAQILTHPMRDLVCLKDKAFDVAVFSASSHEYEVKNYPNSRLFLTLCRSVSSVYRTNLLTKDETVCGVGTRWWTEDGKMLGTIALDYSLRMYPADTDLAEIRLDSLSEKPMVLSEIAEGSAESQKSYVRVEGCILSIVERKEDIVVLRVYNPTDRQRTASVEYFLPFDTVSIVSLAGEEIRRMKLKDGKLNFTINPYEIMTLKIV